MSQGGFRVTKDGIMGRESLATNSEAIQRLAQNERRREELQRSATIEVDLAHPGVTIRIGTTSITLAATVRSMRYYFDSESGALLVTKL